MVSGMEMMGETMNDSSCKPCFEGKQHQEAIPQKSMVEYLCILHCTYSDVCGPMQMKAWTRHLYFMMYINGFSHHVVVKLIKSKDKVRDQTKATSNVLRR